ncbi:MAG TPA: radical SAM protein [Thermoanaerobaculia bacterium]|nr:radical SAM protein [Thermoanaerobaculia bacterium]
MRIMLVRPPVPRHTIGLKHIMICEPLELEYVAAGLEGHEIEIVDLILEKGLERRLKKFKPNVVGTSCYISGVNEAIKICRTVKRWSPECRTVVGGVQASQVPEDFIDPAVDCIVMGDGTTTMPDVVTAFEKGLPLENIPGLALPRGEELFKTPPRAYMPAPDSIPLPRRDLVSHLKHRYYYLWNNPVATMKTTWGCWYKCNFCYTWRITDGVPYSRSAASIAEELSQIEAEHVYIVDDIFLINPTRLGELARILQERGIRKKYLVYARADFISQHEDIIAQWAELGLSAVFIGLEATTDSELDSMDKMATVDHNRAAIALLQKYGIDIYGSLITQPDYVEEDWARLKKFIDDNHLYFLNISPLTPMPGTLIWEQFRDQVTVSRRAHGLWDLSHMILKTRQPLKQYYRSLLSVYCHAALSPRRFVKLNLGTAPPVYTWRYWNLIFGAMKIAKSFYFGHLHHTKRELAYAEDRGPAFGHPLPASGARNLESLLPAARREGAEGG